MKLICQPQGNSSAFGCAPRLAFPLWVLFPVGLCTCLLYTSSTADYEEFLEKKLLLPASEIYDAFDEKARKLYWKQVQELSLIHI